VYLPPGYDGTTQFPVVLWLHGLGHDEKNFLDVVAGFDDAIRAGRVPRAVIAAPDGSVRDKPLNTGSFYLNGVAGNFADYVIDDVWAFVKTNFAVRPEREAHVIAGVSMGGFGAFNLGFKNRTEFGVIVGLMPPLNLRYADCHGKYLTPYDPTCVMFRETNDRREVIGKFYGVLQIRSRRLLDPVLGRKHPDPTPFVSAENPAELLSSLNIQPTEFSIFLGYGKKDEFNLAAQAESFLDLAAARGIRPDVVVVPDGRHNSKTATAMFPTLAKWLTATVGPYAPPGYSAGGCGCGTGTVVPLAAIRRPPDGPIRGMVNRPEPFPPYTGPIPGLPIPDGGPHK
ncbi:MAG: alpha/beta hydrolase, partial [Fimbriiglobus sp.]